MSTLSVRLFGKLSVRRDEQLVDGLTARRVQELFCYLVLYRDCSHPRETLASLLWGDCSTAQSKTYLRKALWQVQTALEPQTKHSNSRVLLVEPNWVQLNSEADLSLDVMMFEQAFNSVQGVRGTALDTRQVQIVRAAVDLYHGDLLEGWYQDWCLYERERLQHMYLSMLDKLMGYCEAHHEYETGLVYGARILRYDRARECSHRRLMNLYYLAGDRTGALRQYERCVTALDEELSVRPDELTVALYERIRADLRDAPTPISTSASISPLLAVIDRLKRFQDVLADVQCQVEQDIQAVERVLKGQR